MGTLDFVIYPLEVKVVRIVSDCIQSSIESQITKGLCINSWASNVHVVQSKKKCAICQPFAL